MRGGVVVGDQGEGGCMRSIPVGGGARWGVFKTRRIGDGVVVVVVDGGNFVSCCCVAREEVGGDVSRFASNHHHSPNTFPRLP